MATIAVETNTEMRAHFLPLARELVAAAKRHDGLAPLDLERFWVDQELAAADPFGVDIPQVPLGIWMNRECVFAELGLPENWYRLYHDPEWVVELAAAYNDISERIVGRRQVSEVLPNTMRQYRGIKELHDIFEGKNTWHHESYWLHPAASNEEELSALLDRVERRLENLREFLLPADWAEQKAWLTPLGINVPRYRGQRGPVTFAMSLYGAENLVFLLLDNEPLAVRFRDLILKAILARAEILDEEAGDTPATAPHGFGFADDNCCLLSPETYALFGYPILKGVFDRYSPNPRDRRYQHSDSAMAHLLPQLGTLGLTAVNFGPTVTVREIREYLPRAVIEGQLAPFTFSRNEEGNIVAEFLRDFEQTREQRGLLFATAGSINNGSRLTGQRLIMAAIQKYGRY